MSIRIQEIIVEDLLSRDDHFYFGTRGGGDYQPFWLLKKFNEEGYPVMVVNYKFISQEDHGKIEKLLGVKFEPCSEMWYGEPKESLCWTPNKDQIGSVMEHIYNYGWTVKRAVDLPALKDVNACCPRCANRNRNGQSVSNECKYCADVPEWALKLEDLGLAHMVLDGGWKWEI